MTLILNERQQEFDHQFNLKSLSTICGREGHGMDGRRGGEEERRVREEWVQNKTDLKCQQQHIHIMFSFHFNKGEMSDSL